MTNKEISVELERVKRLPFDAKLQALLRLRPHIDAAIAKERRVKRLVVGFLLAALILLLRCVFR